MTATASFSQNTGSVHGGLPTGPSTSPYAGQQVRDIKALSPSQTADLLAGKGMEQAKAAELNGYPGPMHVLELAAPLGLSPAQIAASQTLMAGHKTEARALGAVLVEAERKLDAAFANREVDATQVDTLTRNIAMAQARLRASHLHTHLQQTALLTAPQVARYAELRGYTAVPASGSGHPHRTGHGH